MAAPHLPALSRWTTNKGLLAAGDWLTMGVLKHYSGGMLYGGDFDLTVGQGKERVELDLGRVIATCEGRVNSKSAGVLINTPFKLDISEYVRSGKNRIEVLVYNTLANHYQSIPSNYKGKPVSGLIGRAFLVSLCGSASPAGRNQTPARSKWMRSPGPLPVRGPGGPARRGERGELAHRRPEEKSGTAGHVRPARPASKPDLVPWAGEFVGKYLISGVQAMRMSDDPS